MSDVITFPINFLTPEQKAFFSVTKKNSMFSGGFGNGKTHVGCQKLIYLMANFPNYRAVVARYEESKLKQTTMVTFYKVCPPEFYNPAQGGNRADSMNMLKMINGSQCLFMNLKDTDDKMIRGLEINSVLVDQAEEVSESMWLMLAARINRWDRAKIPQEMIDTHLAQRGEPWPRFPNGNYKPPAYMMGLCNPDSELHWIYRRFHPESEQFRSKYHTKHVMIQGATTAATIDPELLEDMMDNDQTWVERFVFGKWGIPGGQIHQVSDQSILRIGNHSDDSDGDTFKGVYCDAKFVKILVDRGNLYRVLDHGDSAPTCCLWFSVFQGNYYCFREYYKGNALISEHRRNISALSGEERYFKNLIDPQCAKKTLQKYGTAWTHIEEYRDTLDIAYRGVPPIYWDPADNNELVTRNRISELLRIDDEAFHPVTGEKGSPRLFFIERNANYNQGCYHSISQLRSQKRQKIGTIEGRDIYSDDRAEGVEDHAYDPVRYFCADHGLSPANPKPKPNPNSFMSIRKNFIEFRNQMGVSA